MGGQHARALPRAHLAQRLIGDFLQAARAIDEEVPGFSGKFMAAAAIDRLADAVYAAAQPRFADCVK